MTTLFTRAEPDLRTPVPTQPVQSKEETMHAVVFKSSGNVEVETVPKPMITDPRDAIVRITMTSICGSDLHLYHNLVKGMKKGDVLGHEAVGIVEQVGDGVKDLSVGQRVAISAIIADGTCWYCQRGLFSCCDTTNPSIEMEKTYGHRIAGVFGYSHMTGGYPGLQADYVRVPYAETNCLPLPAEISDEKGVLLSDVACTAWHACELANVGDNDHKSVAIWGCGPVGLMSAAWAKARGATRVVCIDRIPTRLAIARNMGADCVINYDTEDVLKRLQECFPSPPGGPDSCIDCVGFRYRKTTMHKISATLGMEDDSVEVLTEAITACRKGGSLAIIGDYFATASKFPIGAMMEKALVVRGGQVFVQKYWKEVLRRLVAGEADPTPMLTHRLSLSQAEQAYKLFDSKDENCVKILLSTGPAEVMET